MSPELTHAMLKEWYWPVIIGALIAVAFAPSFLKSKCPACGKRKLRSFDFDNSAIAVSGFAKDDLPPFTIYYLCDGCHARLKRFRSGPLLEATDQHYDVIFDQEPRTV
jgi:hypothetical protein